MRCGDVIQELAAPTGIDLSEHLAQCPQCSAWAARDAQLNRLWNVTRPPAPSATTWDAAWFRLSSALPRPEILPMTPPARPGRRAAVVLLGVAQAAALLFVLLYHSHPANNPQITEISQISYPVVFGETIEIDAGQLAVIRGDSAGVRMTDLALNENAAGVDFTFDGLNALEAIAPQ